MDAAHLKRTVIRLLWAEYGRAPDVTVVDHRTDRAYAVTLRTTHSIDHVMIPYGADIHRIRNGLRLIPGPRGL